MRSLKLDKGRQASFGIRTVALLGIQPGTQVSVQQTDANLGHPPSGEEVTLGTLGEVLQASFRAPRKNLSRAFCDPRRADHQPFTNGYNRRSQNDSGRAENRISPGTILAPVAGFPDPTVAPGATTPV